MSYLPRISGKQAVQAFQKAGWTFRSVPNHKELATGTLRKLIRVADMEVDMFISLL